MKNLEILNIGVLEESERICLFSVIGSFSSHRWSYKKVQFFLQVIEICSPLDRRTRCGQSVNIGPCWEQRGLGLGLE
ncbi:hypothetical protein SLS54_008052 [Diplodia seriata]